MACSWQNLLDDLTTNTFNEEITSIPEKYSFEDKVNFCFRNDRLRKVLSSWMRQCLCSTESKSTAKSVRFRHDGNKAFLKKEDAVSLDLYSRSVVYAIAGTEELALALGNRSASAFNLFLFEECLKDIDLALSSGYPKHLTYKLLMRKGKSLLALRRLEIAAESFTACENAIDEAGLTDRKRDNLKKELSNALSQCSLQSLTNSMSDDISSTPEMPSPLHGESSELAYASCCLTLRTSETKGRHIVTNHALSRGDVLFVEKPFAFVVLPDHYSTNCHHCCKGLCSPIPCGQCTEAFYCSEECRGASWQCYHRWECGGLSVFREVGIAHLGLRLALVGAQATDQARYDQVCNLVSHLDQQQPSDLYQYTLTATLLTLYLEQYTDLLKDLDAKVVGGHILHHIGQLICNGHAISQLVSQLKLLHLCESTSYSDECQSRIATAIYPSASMMNHSCDPNISNSFYNAHLVVRASKDIGSGEEVFNCYGPHYRHMSLAERQRELAGQYHFACDCGPCSQPTASQYQDRAAALRCGSCHGPLLKAGLAWRCGDCNSQETKEDDLCVQLQQCRTTFQLGLAELDSQNIHKAMAYFEQCLSCQSKYLYRHNRELVTTVDEIAKCHSLLGEYQKSIKLLEANLVSIGKLYGEESIELANEINKLLSLILTSVQLSPPGSTPDREVFTKALTYSRHALKIFELDCGLWHRETQEALVFEREFHQLCCESQ